MDESRRMYSSMSLIWALPCHSYGWVTLQRAMSLIWMSHVACTNKSCLTHEWALLSITIKVVGGWEPNEPSETHEWVKSHVWMSHVSHWNVSFSPSNLKRFGCDVPKEQCHTFEWVMSHIWIRRVSHMNESCHTWKSHIAHCNESCHTYEWAMSHTWVSHLL